MSMLPASRVELKRNLSRSEIDETASEIRKIAGQFNIMSSKNPVVLIVNTSNPDKLSKIRALPNVAKVGHQF